MDATTKKCLACCKPWMSLLKGQKIEKYLAKVTNHCVYLDGISQTVLMAVSKGD